MKRIYFFLAMVFVMNGVRGQVYEDFNYASPGNVGGTCNPNPCTNNNWTTHSASNAGTIDVILGSLNYTGLQASTGNKVKIPGSNATTNRDINRSTAISGTPTVAYYSFLLNVLDNTQLGTTHNDNAYFFSFGNTVGNSVTVLYGRTSIRSVNGGANFRLGLSNTTGGTPTYTDVTTDLSFGTAYLMVFKYDFNGVSNDIATIWVNPTSLGGIEPSGGTSNSSGTASTPTTFASVVIRNSSATPNAEIDEIRTGTTWASVTPVPIPTVSSFTPTSGYTGSSLVISGTDFTGATAVTFGGTSAASFTVDNSTQITATVGTGASGSVSVTTPGGTGSLAGFTYLGYRSNASGNWETGSTWLGGVSPGTSCADVTIDAAQTVTVNAAAANCKSLQINSGGELVVSGNALTVGCSNNNNLLNTDGTLTVSGGTLNINGNLAINAGATFNHSSGNINVDGNAAGVAINSVASITPLVNFVSNNLNLTGGTLTIIDPHQANSAYALQYNNSTAHVNLPTTYTIKFGDGISTETGGTNGFYLNTSQGLNGLALGNVIIEGSASGIRRNVTLFSNVCISGDITINGATGELLIQTGNTLHAGGNITVNSGAFLKDFGSGVLALQSFTNETVSPGTIAQTISGSGTFSDNVSPTANFQRLTINNSSAGGVTFSNDVQVSGILTMVTGKAIMSGSTQTMTLGFSTGTQGSLTHSGGYIVGKFKRWINGTGSRQFPVGFGSNLKDAVINFTVAPSPGGTLTAQWINASPNFPNASPLMEGAITIDAAGLGYWLIDAGDGLTGGTYTGTFTNNGASLGNFLNTALIKRPTAGGDWILDGTHVTTSGSNTNPSFSRTGMSGFSQFGYGGTASTLPVSFVSFSGYKSGSVNKLQWTTSSEQNNVGFDVQRSLDGMSYTSIGFVNTLAPGGNSATNLNYNFTDNSVAGSKQFYRLRQVDIDNRSRFSTVVLIKGDKPTTIAIDGLFPNPASSVVNVLIAAPSKDKVTVMVTDMAGRTVAQQVANVETGSNTIPIDISRLINGTYMVKLVCANGCEGAVGKFVKQ